MFELILGFFFSLARLPVFPGLYDKPGKGGQGCCDCKTVSGTQLPMAQLQVISRQATRHALCCSDFCQAALHSVNTVNS